MWIFLSVIALIVILISVILLSPVHIIIKSGKDDELIILYKYLFWTFGENPNPNHPIVRALKKSTGIDKLDKESLQSSAEESGFQTTAAQTVEIVIDLLREVVTILRFCTARRFKLHVLCSSKDAAEAAISYGQCCAFVYPMVGLANANMRVKKSGADVKIDCDFNGVPEFVRYDFLISVRLNHLLAALWRVSLKEAKREAEQQQNQSR